MSKVMLSLVDITDLKLSKGDGTLSANTDGSWTFMPSKDWNGRLSFLSSQRGEGEEKSNDK